MSENNTRQPTQDVFELVLARSVQHAAGVDPWLVHVWWRAPQQGARLVQIYLDQVLVDVTIDPRQREAWIFADRSRPHQVELLAVAADDAENLWRPHRELLATWNPPVQSEVTLKALRDPAFPVNTCMSVAIDGATVDVSPLWPANESRIGFGALFGLGEFGFDNATAPGLGSSASQLGWGPLGSDATAWEWRSDDLTPGSHEIQLQPVLPDGRPVGSEQSWNVTIDEIPRAPQQVTIASDFTLSWTD